MPHNGTRSQEERGRQSGQGFAEARLYNARTVTSKNEERAAAAALSSLTEGALRIQDRQSPSALAYEGEASDSCGNPQDWGLHTLPSNLGDE